MNKKQMAIIVIVVLVGLFIGFLFSRSGSEPAAPAPAPVATIPTPPKAAPAAASSSPLPAKNPIPSPPKVVVNKQQVLPPSAPPAQAPKAAQNSPPAQPLTAQEQRQVLNNLRMLSSAGQQYMLMQGVTQASYYDLVGTGTDSFIHSVDPVAGEDYQDIVIFESSTQISVATPDGSEVTFTN